ncbi:DUF6192 family protein [Crossiella cryophila]|uniref:DUF6192 family protein n=1 Tax=Crossiella cryophila TaxID=43355 RepID=UPI003899136F
MTRPSTTYPPTSCAARRWPRPAWPGRGHRQTGDQPGPGGSLDAGGGHRAPALPDPARTGPHHRVRAALEWTESAVDTGNTSLDEGLAKLLRGQ